MYELCAGDFCLKLGLVPFCDEPDNPCNSYLEIAVSSDGFSGTAAPEFDRRAFALFTKELLALYETLCGAVRLEPFDGGSFLELWADRTGHIHIRGKLCGGRGSGYTQGLLFENEFDQTLLRPFAQKLFADWQACLP